MLISHNAPYLPPKILHKHCFQLLLGRLKYLGEVKNKSYAKFGGGEGWGQIRCIMGDMQVAYGGLWVTWLIPRRQGRER